MVLDSMGNILKDTLYSNGYVGGGAIYKDLNGGYVHIGEFDSLYTSNPSDIENFPGYIAHLDSDFRITWITPFSYSYTDGHRDRVILRQLQDSSYIVIGAAFTNYAPNSFGWAAKVDRNGNILWDHYYVSDSTHEAYFRDVVEMPNGNLVFVGATFNDTLPAWHSLQDMWIVGVDSNGCEIPGCTTTRVNNVPTINTFIQIYPNPTYGNFTIKAPQAGELAVYNIQSQQVAVYKVNAGETNLKLPSTINPGVYVCRYVAEQRDSLPVVIRLLYEP